METFKTKNLVPFTSVEEFTKYLNWQRARRPELEEEIRNFDAGMNSHSCREDELHQFEDQLRMVFDAEQYAAFLENGVDPAEVMEQANLDCEFRAVIPLVVVLLAA